MSQVNVLDYIPIGHSHAISRRDLCMITGLDDRQLRRDIHYARRHTAIINLQNGDGYYIPDPDDPVDCEALKDFVSQETCRLKSIGWSLSAARKMLRERGES